MLGSHVVAPLGIMCFSHNLRQLLLLVFFFSLCHSITVTASLLKIERNPKSSKIMISLSNSAEA